MIELIVDIVFRLTLVGIFGWFIIARVRPVLKSRKSAKEIQPPPKRYDPIFTALLEHDRTAGFNPIVQVGIDPNHCEICSEEFHFGIHTAHEKNIPTEQVGNELYAVTKWGANVFQKYGRDHWAGCPCRACNEDYAGHNQVERCECQSCQMHRTVT